MTRPRSFALAIGIIAVGLLLRLGPWHLPLWLHHYGGAFVWGAMVLVLVAAVRPTGWSWGACFAMASAIVISVEFVRLYRTPALDAFRTTLAGQLLLGRIFSPWNIAAYELGILAGMAAIQLLDFRRHQGFGLRVRGDRGLPQPEADHAGGDVTKAPASRRDTK